MLFGTGTKKAQKPEQSPNKVSDKSVESNSYEKMRQVERADLEVLDKGVYQRNESPAKSSDNVMEE